tara:strand:+ start:1436 stop:1741 length:306 start_codon:yes stop_codon:yes gene_type:complete
MSARFLAALALISLYGSPAFSRGTDCADFEVWSDALEKNFGEVKTHVGLSASKQVVIELFENPETHTFTLLTTDPYGVSCPLAGGGYWETVDNGNHPNPSP